MRHVCFAVFVSVFAGCASGGKVTVRNAITTPVKSFGSAAVVVKAADPSMTNAAMHVKNLRDVLSAKLHASGLFENVYGEAEAANAKLIIKVQLLEIVDGSKDLMAGGVSSAKLEVDFFDRANAQSVGLLDVEGNSEKNTSTSIGGVNTDAFADTMKRSFERAAEHLVNHLKGGSA